MINARSETVAEKPAFKNAFLMKRCLIPADGFFEWKKVPGQEGEKPSKVPHWIHRKDGAPFAMAGLWEEWRPKEGDPLFTFTILTTESTSGIRDIHPRMPVILPDEAARRWLGPVAGPSGLHPLLRPNVENLHAHAVSTLVNSPRNDVPDCVQPV